MPFIAHLGLRPLLTGVCARERARRGRHRGLSLVSMAVGIAATVRCVALALDLVGGLERGDELVAQIGVHLGATGAALSAIGSDLLAEEIERDDEERVGDRLRASALRRWRCPDRPSHGARRAARRRR